MYSSIRRPILAPIDLTLVLPDDSAFQLYYNAIRVPRLYVDKLLKFTAAGVEVVKYFVRFWVAESSHGRVFTSWLKRFLVVELFT